MLRSLPYFSVEPPTPALLMEPSPTVVDVGDPSSSLQAEYERRPTARLADLSGPSVLFLHNRLLGQGRRDGDVDHLALTAGGVYVIDAKRYKNAKVEVRRSGGLFSPVREQLMVNGRDCSELLDSVARQAAAVRTALSTFHPHRHQTLIQP